MQLLVRIGHATLTALLDFGSTHNFIDTSVAKRIGLVPQATTGFRVTVVNGDRLASSGCYTDLAIGMTDEPFSITCCGLVLGSFEMVLRVQWHEALGDVLWDFHRHMLAFVCNGCRVVWSATPSSC
jgi:hypothetical protein